MSPMAHHAIIKKVNTLSILDSKCPHSCPKWLVRTLLELLNYKALPKSMSRMDNVDSCSCEIGIRSREDRIDNYQLGSLNHLQYERFYIHHEDNSEPVAAVG